MQQFVITLRNEKISSYNRISWICIFLHFIIFTYAALFSTDESVYKGGAVAIVLLAIAVAIVAYISRKKPLHRSVMPVIYFSLTIGWIMMGVYLLVIVPISFAAMYLIATRKFIVTVNAEQVVYPSFPSKRLSWNQLSNILLKDGLLTIELKQDKLIQQMVDEKKTTVDEKDFNEFCRIALRKNRASSDKKPGVSDIIEAIGNAADGLH